MRTEPQSFLAGGLKGIKKIVHIDNAESTQDLAKSLAQAGFHACAVIADTQSAGRGRLLRPWASSEGGLYLSVTLQPKAAPESLSDLSVKTAEVAAAVLKELYGIGTKIKMPNDVLAWSAKARKPLKIAGILVETSSSQGESDWVVLGIGVNLNNAIGSELAEEATSVRKLTGKTADREEFVRRFFETFWDTYSSWEIRAASHFL